MIVYSSSSSGALHPLALRRDHDACRKLPWRWGSLASYADWSLDGNERDVLDSSLGNRSRFNLKAQQLTAGLQLALSFGYIETCWLRRFDQGLDYDATNATPISAEAADSNGWMGRYVLR